MSRTPLSEGCTLTMANGGKYTIKKLIAEGGFSLIYSADTAGGTSSAVIKEFFPAEGAFRGSSGKVLPVIGREAGFDRSFVRFESEGRIGGKISEASFQTIPFMISGEGYALMKRESGDMRSLSDLVDSWEKEPPLPFTGNPKDRDPVFPDMVRVRYALRIAESLLTALGTMHDKGYLHLDISSRNVIWAGRDASTGENCEAFLADFGCASELDSGEYHPEHLLSYSPGFAAPEVLKEGSRLTPATDIYSAGMLLFFLCAGRNALEITRNRRRQVQRETAYLAIPERIREELQHIILTAADDNMGNRYQTADKMLSDVRSLKNSIPQHPLNPDNTKAFTLYSLKSMLEGSEDTHYSWADELRDRRDLEVPSFPEGIHKGLSWKEFRSDDQFLGAVLPEEIREYLFGRAAECTEGNKALESILSCNYDISWKREICKKIKRYGTRQLLVSARSILNEEKYFFAHQRVLFELLGEDGRRLKECYHNCGPDIRKAPYVGLAMFTVYAMLGPDGFEMLLPSPADAGELFFAL